MAAFSQKIFCIHWPIGIGRSCDIMLTYGVLLLCCCQLHSPTTQKTTRTAHHIPMASGKNRTFFCLAGTDFMSFMLFVSQSVCNISNVLDNDLMSPDSRDMMNLLPSTPYSLTSRYTPTNYHTYSYDCLLILFKRI